MAWAMRRQRCPVRTPIDAGIDAWEVVRRGIQRFWNTQFDSRVNALAAG